MNERDKTPAQRGKSHGNAIIRVCILCGGAYRQWGHNPFPLSSVGRCCDDCNSNKVVPERIRRGRTQR